MFILLFCMMKKKEEEEEKRKNKKRKITEPLNIGTAMAVRAVLVLTAVESI